MDEQIDKNGNTIQKLEDGSTRITTPDGRTFLVDKDGNTNVNLPTIQKVSIDNIIDLKSHIIMRDGEKTTHKIELLDGGTVNLSFMTDGQLVEFSGKGIRQSITKNNEVIIKSLSSKHEE